MAIGLEAAQTDAFDFVFNVHRDYVYKLVRALLRNPQDAEDVTQDVFLRVYMALPSYRPECASMRTWLSRLAVNACQTHRRRNFLRGLLHHDSGEEAMLDMMDPSPLAAPEDHAMHNELRRTVREVVGRLGQEHRTVLVLRYYMDLSCSEIAAVLDCPEGTVHSRLHYARRVVQAQLERHSPRPTTRGEVKK